MYMGETSIGDLVVAYIIIYYVDGAFYRKCMV